MKWNHLTALVFLLPFIFISSGCEKINIRHTPTNIEIDEFSLILEATVWRNFQPIMQHPDSLLGDNNFSAMISVNSLIDQNQNDMSSRFELEVQFVVASNKVWESTYTDQRRDTKEYEIERVSKDGPKWRTGRKVDVICQFRDLLTGEAYRIMVKNQEIQRLS